MDFRQFLSIFFPSKLIPPQTGQLLGQHTSLTWVNTRISVGLYISKTLLEASVCYPGLYDFANLTRTLVGMESCLGKNLGKSLGKNLGNCVGSFLHDVARRSHKISGKMSQVQESRKPRLRLFLHKKTTTATNHKSEK